ncbi:hypothetical protein FOG18_07030 [Legionella israelensis]|uniref:hypothetical protein n=1 Tax=Legionella israelensis TaxID=454 RepID=UPI00117F6DDF|nr:hypothetical protein [Legionella israelensis]QDP72325.1 hypothetical protein FOG18_07030 [Legionella israelensis]
MPRHIKQYQINSICSALLFFEIRTTQDLVKNFYPLLDHINKNPDIFKSKYSTYQCYEMLKEAVKAFNEVYAYSINCPEIFIYALREARRQRHEDKSIPVEGRDDLYRVTRSYDRVSRVSEKKKAIHEDILDILDRSDFSICPEIIIGEGDTGTNLWLEKFTSEHKKSKEKLSKGKLPSVLMISDGTGSWKHNYTLAQPQNLLERTTSKANPSDYMTRDYYGKNPYANGRHIYQANQVSLAKTQAPVLQATVQKIEKKSNHLKDWQVEDCDYRLVVKTSLGTKIIYTHAVNICTGLGPARNTLGSIISKEDLRTLSQYDMEKKYTPIVDGNQFILTDSEEERQQKTMVIYGGGGTAAAIYRKGFYGDDIKRDSLEFEEKDKKNKVIWFAKQFNKAGTGKLASSALYHARMRNELFQGKLVKIEPQTNGKLLLTFMLMGKNEVKVECDQLVYAIGQDDKGMRAVCEEIDSDLALQFDPHGMILNVSSQDKKIVFFGAAAMAVREKEYMEETWRWLKEQNIGGDVGPGSMPPSRAQIKCYLALQGILPKSINVNMDSHHLVIEYLLHYGAKETAIKSFIADLLAAREQSTSGASYFMLLKLLEKYELNETFKTYGHGFLVAKEIKLELLDPLEELPRFSLFSRQKHTPDSSIFLSSVEKENNEALASNDKKPLYKKSVKSLV